MKSKHLFKFQTGQVGFMDASEIIRAVMEKEYQISPEAVEIIKSSNSPESLLQYVLSTVNDSVIVIDTEHINLEDFAIFERALKSISDNGKNEENFNLGGLEENSSYRETQVSSIQTESSLSKPLSRPSIISSGPNEISPEPDIRVSIPDSISGPYQNTVLESISSPSTIPQALDIQSTVVSNIPQEENLESNFVPSSSASLKTTSNIPEIVFSSQPSQVENRPASSFFGNEGALPFSFLNRASRSESPFSNGKLFSDSRNEEYRHFPGKNPVTILSDITGHSSCVGEYMQFVQYFRDRYSKLSEIIRGRINARPIESLKKRNFRRSGGDGNAEEISIIGMVSDISTTNNGHKILSLEDPTASFSVLIRNTDKELFELASKILLDEVIGVAGSVTNDGNLMLATKIIQPDIPNNVQRRTGTYGKAVLISDVHVGSSQFLEEAWLDFLDFLKGESDSEVYERTCSQYSLSCSCRRPCRRHRNLS